MRFRGFQQSQYFCPKAPTQNTPDNKAFKRRKNDLKRGGRRIHAKQKEEVLSKNFEAGDNKDRRRFYIYQRRLVVDEHFCKFLFSIGDLFKSHT